MKFLSFIGWERFLSKFKGCPDTLDALLDALDEAGIAISIFDSHSLKLVRVNQTYCKFFGYTESEIYAAKSYLDLAPPEVRREAQSRAAMRSKNISTPKKFVTQGLTKSGEVIDIEVSIKQVLGTEFLSVCVISLKK